MPDCVTENDLTPGRILISRDEKAWRIIGIPVAGKTKSYTLQELNTSPIISIEIIAGVRSVFNGFRLVPVEEESYWLLK